MAAGGIVPLVALAGSGTPGACGAAAGALRNLAESGTPGVREQAAGAVRKL